MSQNNSTLARPASGPTPSPTTSTPEADPDARRRWQLETPTGRLEIVADDCDITKGGASIAIDAEWFERLGRRYIYWRRAFPQTIARANRQVSLRVAAKNFACFRDHGGPNLTPCDRDGVDAEVLALFEREFLRRATPKVIIDLIGEIEALHNVVLDLDPAFCWEKTVRKFVNRLTRHPEEEGERDESGAPPAITVDSNNGVNVTN